MTAREGMTDLITQLRAMTDTGESDYTVNGASYWTDAQLQTVLDANRTDIRHIELERMPSYTSGGSVVYREHALPTGNLESGTAVFYIQNATGATISTANYTVDYQRGRVTFTADQAGSANYVTARTYNLEQSAADVWTRKAAHLAAGAMSWSSDNMSVNKSNLITTALNMAQHYRSLAGPTTITLYRGDLC